MSCRMVLCASVILASSFLSMGVFGGEHAGQGRARLSSAPAREFTRDDIRAEVAFGRDIAAQIIGKFGLYKDLETARYVNLVGTLLAQYANRSELSFHFGVLDTDAVGTYAAPGGFVFITRGALVLMQDEAELAGSLAAGMALIGNRAVVNDLGIRAREQPSLASELIMAPFAPLSLAARHTAVSRTSVDMALDILLRQGHQPEQVIAADRIAAYTLAFAGYDPDGLVRFLVSAGSTSTSSGPIAPDFFIVRERIAQLRSYIGQEGLQGVADGANRERFAPIKRKLQAPVYTRGTATTP